MNDLLEQAIVVGQAGDKDQAYLLLARLIKQQPHNAEAWYYLSTLVDSPEQQLVFTRRTLAIEQQHPLARQRLAELTGQPVEAVPTPPALAGVIAPDRAAAEPAVAVEPVLADEPDVADEPVVAPPALSEDLTFPLEPGELLLQDDDEMVPNWLMEDLEAVATEAGDMTAVEFDLETDDFPDWLQEEPEPTPQPVVTKIVSAPVDQPAQKKAPSGAARPTSPKKKKKQSPNWLLIILFLATIVVLILFMLAAAVWLL